MDEKFKNDIVEDLNKSGFGSELKAIKTFINKEWACTGFANFFDTDQEIVTGVDLRAWHHQIYKYSEKLSYGIRFAIDAEVKKSEKPWVVFKERTHRVNDDYLNNLTYCCDIIPHKLRNAISQHSVYTKAKWKAYGLHESFKKPSAPSRAYSAFIKVCKSAESTLDADSAYYKEMVALRQSPPAIEDYFKDIVFLMVKPIVILDGNLIAAELSDKGEILLEAVKSAAIEFHYKSKQCKKGVYMIDIVTLEGLKEYIDLTEARIEAIYDEIEHLARREA